MGGDAVGDSVRAIETSIVGEFASGPGYAPDTSLDRARFPDPLCHGDDGRTGGREARRAPDQRVE